MRSVEIGAFAEADLAEAYSFYESRSPGQGQVFLSRFRSGLVAIQTLPAGYPVTDPPYRCHHLQKFPFSIMYDFDADTIYIVAVKNQNRKAGYWLDRLQDLPS